MQSILEQITDWLKSMIISGIMGNLSGMFDSVNQQVGQIAGDVGTTPANFSPAVFSMIRNISESVILPIAGMVLTFIACYELIQMLIEHNNLANFETWTFFKWVFKTFLAVTLISNTFNITMAVFDVAQQVLSRSGGLISGSTSVSDATLTAMQATLEGMDLGPLLGLYLQTFVVQVTMLALSAIIFVIVYGRMVEIYLMVSLAPIPFATFGNHEQSHNHYVRDGFGKLRISKIKYSDIKKFYYSLILEKGFKPNSMEIVHTLLHPTFTMAVRDGLLRLNPTEGVMAEIKKSHCWEKTKRHALTVAEQRAFTNYIANSEEYRGWFPLFTVMLGTGCRIGEVLGLRWQDVDFKNRTISINHNLVYRVQEDGTCTNHVNSPKTKAGIRIIPMIDEVFDAFLEEYQYQKVIGFCTDEIDGYSGFVFCTGDGKVYLPNAINRTIRSICADYNKEEESKAKEENRDPVLLPKFSCHILRHTFCTRFCENETNLKVIQEIMGHADISTTMDVYAEATQEKKKESMTSLQSALLVR